MTIEHNFFFTKYQYCYMFRPREVISRLALEYFERNIQIELRKMRSQILHNAFSLFPLSTLQERICEHIVQELISHFQSCNLCIHFKIF